MVFPVSSEQQKKAWSGLTSTRISLSSGEINRYYLWASVSHTTNIQRCESDNGYPNNVKMVVYLINIVSAKFADLTSTSAGACKIRLYAYPEEVFSSPRVPIAFPWPSCDWGIMVPQQHFDGGSS